MKVSDVFSRVILTNNNFRVSIVEPDLSYVYRGIRDNIPHDLLEEEISDFEVDIIEGDLIGLIEIGLKDYTT